MTSCPAWQDNDGLLAWGLIQMEDLNDFALLAAVVDHGSFSAAGRALGFPRSKVSRRVADLEQRLGVRLLQRSTRAVSLTEVGAEFYTHCKSITRSAQWALDVAERATQHPSGRIWVSCPTGVAHLFLAELLPRFLLTHPDVQVDLELTSRRVEPIAESIDVAIRVRSSLDDSGLILRSFGVSRQVLVASPGFVHAHGPFVSAAALHEVLGMGPHGVNGEPPRWRLTSPQGTSELVDYRVRACSPRTSNCCTTLRWPAWAWRSCRWPCAGAASPVANWWCCWATTRCRRINYTPCIPRVADWRRACAP